MKKALADKTNQLVQYQTQAEKHKKMRTENWKKRRALVKGYARPDNAPNGGPNKKPMPYPQVPMAQAVSGPAKGYLLRTSSLSDEDPGSDVKVEVEMARARA